MESEFVQEGHIGNGDSAATVEDGIYQDETKNSHLGKLLSCMFTLFCFICVHFVYFCFILFSLLADAEISHHREKEGDGQYYNFFLTIFSI